MVGAIIFGYVIMGLLDGYIVTTTWYQSKVSPQSWSPESSIRRYLPAA